jgi:selenocysteine lyase/cysteine desulfurase
MGYCYLSRSMQKQFTPINAGWRAGADPFASFFGPTMDLSPTASRFDSSISWLAALGNEAALAVFHDYGPDVIYAHNRHLETQLRDGLAAVGWDPVPLPAENRSTIVSVPLDDLEPTRVVGVLSQKGVVSSARDGALRLSVHLYNHEDDIDRLLATLRTLDVTPAHEDRR